MSVNKVILIGRLGKDPEIKYIQPDVAFAKFSIATSESYKNKTGGWTENTEWHNIVCWRNTAKYAENNLKKGMMIYIEGKLQTRKWTDQDGKQNSITEIVVNNFVRLEKAKSNTAINQTETETTEDAPVKQDIKPANDTDFKPESNNQNDDLPF